MNFWPRLQYYSSQIGTTELAKQCAEVAGFEWSDLRLCAEGSEGSKLLRTSVEEVKELGVEKSATLLLGEKHMVHFSFDGN